MYVCMHGYAIRHALRYRAETWHGGRGQAHEVFEHIFERHPQVKLLKKCPTATKSGRKNLWPNCDASLGSKVMQDQPGQPGVKLLRNALRTPKLVGRSPDQGVEHCWGWRSCRGQPRVKLLRNATWPPNLVGRLECNTLMGSKVMQGSSAVNQKTIVQNV